MSEIEGYFLIILSTSLVSVLAGGICHGKMKRATETVLGISVLIAILSPLPTVVRQISEDASDMLGSSAAGEDLLYEDTAREALCQGIARAVAEKFNCSEEAVSVAVSGFSFPEMTFEWAHIKLSEEGRLLSPPAVREFIENSFSGRCTVEILI